MSLYQKMKSKENLGKLSPKETELLSQLERVRKMFMKIVVFPEEEEVAVSEEEEIMAVEVLELEAAIIEAERFKERAEVVLKKSELILGILSRGKKMNKENPEMIEKIEQERQEEIKEGKNAITYPPLYVVFDVTTSAADEHSNYTISTSLFSDNDGFGWVSEDHEIEWTEEEYAEARIDISKELEVCSDEDRPYLLEEKEVLEHAHCHKVGFHDRFITCCFTRQAAEDFIKAERHNLKNPRIWVHNIERRNYQLRRLGEMFGDVN